jgi:hypothetical protein
MLYTLQRFRVFEEVRKNYSYGVKNPGKNIIL